MHEAEATSGLPLAMIEVYKMMLGGGGESLSIFVEQSIRENIQRRQLQCEFVERDLLSREAARQTNAYLSADTVVGRLEEMLSAAKSVK